MSRLVPRALVALLLVACSATHPRGAPIPPPVAVAVPVPAPVPTEAAVPVGAPHGRTFRGHPEDELLQAMATRPVERVIERFNSSTLVFHIALEGGLEIAFKPARRGEGNWWRHEIAGYRLARALGIEHRVPPAITRRVPLSAFHGFTRGARLVVSGPGRTVEGAAIFWMPVLHHSHLETDAAARAWNTWFDPTRPVPPEHRVVAEQLASLLVLDYLDANFDRWNAANTPVDEHGDLVLRDNNRAWYTQNLRLTDRGGIDQIRRIPAWLLAGVSAATGPVVRAAIEADPGRKHGGLSPRDYDLYEARRRVLLDHLWELIGRYGRDAVVAW